MPIFRRTALNCDHGNTSARGPSIHLPFIRQGSSRPVRLLAARIHRRHLAAGPLKLFPNRPKHGIAQRYCQENAMPNSAVEQPRPHDDASVARTRRHLRGLTTAVSEYDSNIVFKRRLLRGRTTAALSMTGNVAYTRRDLRG